jgi:ADP-ribosylglycohydrolase
VGRLARAGTVLPMAASAQARTIERRIRGGMLGFFLGDALGAAWEGEPPERVDLSAPPRALATSDDSQQLLLGCRALSRPGLGGVNRRYLDLLAERIDDIADQSPASEAAVVRYLDEEEETAAGAADTSGALLRAPAVGWAVASATERRNAAVRLTAATHGGAGAKVAAAIVAALCGWALDGRLQAHLVRLVPAEADVVAGRVGLPRRRLAAVTAACEGRYEPPASGVGHDALETLAAVVSVVRRALPLQGALEQAVSLGGNTDTVAALVGGVVASRIAGEPDVAWSRRVLLPDGGEVDRLARELAARRAG